MRASQNDHFNRIQANAADVTRCKVPVDPPLEPIPDWAADGWLGFYTKIAALALFAGALVWIIR